MTTVIGAYHAVTERLPGASCLAVFEPRDRLVLPAILFPQTAYLACSDKYDGVTFPRFRRAAPLSDPQERICAVVTLHF
jgi:hypothetical protein